MSDPQEQMNALISAIEADPQPPTNWLNLAGIFLSNQMWDPLISLFEMRDSMLKDGPVLMFQMLLSETVGKVPQLHDALTKYEGKKIDTTFLLILHYVSGAMKINKGRIQEGRQAFRDIAEALKNDADLIKNIPHIHSLDWLADQFVTFDEIEACQKGGGTAIPLAPIEWVGTVDVAKYADRPVIMSSCNDVYFDKFGDSFIQSLKGKGAIHIHVVNGDVEGLRLKMGEYSDVALSFSAEKYELGGGSPYFASVRFLRVGDVMEKFNRDVAMMDIDVEKVQQFDRLIDVAKAKNITLFKNISIVPWLHHWATFIYYTNTSATKEYQKHMKNTLLHHLSGAKWFVDQSILNCVNQYADSKMADVNIQYLSDDKGFKLFDYILPAGTAKEKTEIRTKADF